MHRTFTLVGSLAALAVASLAPRARAQADSRLPNPDAIDMAPIDLATFDYSLGGVTSFHDHTHSDEGRQGLTVARASMLGFRVRAVEFEVLARPVIETASFSGMLVSIDEWMIGSSNSDSSLCLWWPQVLCDPESGRWGFGVSALGLQYDQSGGRGALRAGELRWLWSATPAYARDWSRSRFMPFVGASLDRIWNLRDLPNKWIARAALGIDAAFRVGDFSIEPTVKWRPSASQPFDDFGVESTLTAMSRGTWHAVNGAGDALGLGVQLGYAYWSVPGYAYGADWSTGSESTFFVRLVFAPSLFSVFPP